MTVELWAQPSPSRVSVQSQEEEAAAVSQTWLGLYLFVWWLFGT